jgi:hypothetical protein
MMPQRFARHYINEIVSVGFELLSLIDKLTARRQFLPAIPNDLKTVVSSALGRNFAGELKCRNVYK